MFGIRLVIFHIRMLMFIFLIVICRPMEVPVSKFLGFDSLAENEDSKMLTWVIEPWNASLFWIRCYRDRVTDETHFFTYDHNNAQTWKGGPFKNRTVIYSFTNPRKIPIRFSLTIEYLRKSDAGKYICELESYGASTPQLASLHLYVFLQTTGEESSKFPTQVSTDQSQTWPWTANYTGKVNEENAERKPILSLIMIVTIPSVTAVILLSLCLAWKLYHRPSSKPSSGSVGNPVDGVLEQGALLGQTKPEESV